MRIFKRIYLIALIINVSQLYAQSLSDSVDLYSPFYEYTYLNFDSVERVYYRNNCLSVLDLRSNKCNPTIIKFYPTGEISMLAQKCDLRALDSKGEVNGDLKLYNSNGEILLIMEYRNSLVYNGYYFNTFEMNGVNIDYYENGILQSKYKFINHVLTLVQSDSKEKIIRPKKGNLKQIVLFIETNFDNNLTSLGANANAW
jgi:antitoxin component YwqK of YwqJK toxin-antitoxin module